MKSSLTKADKELKNSLISVDCHVDDDFIKGLSEDQKRIALEWAEKTFCDYCGVEIEVPEKPEFLPEQTYE